MPSTIPSKHQGSLKELRANIRFLLPVVIFMNEKLSTYVLIIYFLALYNSYILSHEYLALFFGTGTNRIAIWG